MMKIYTGDTVIIDSSLVSEKHSVTWVSWFEHYDITRAVCKVERVYDYTLLCRLISSNNEEDPYAHADEVQFIDVRTVVKVLKG